MKKLVEMLNISKSFGDVRANDNVNLDLCEGEIHGIVGGNGAGKSTLMKILFGLLKPDSGKIKINGEEKRFNSTQDAINEKIGMVHQDFVLVDTLSALDNIILGREPVKFGFIKREDVKDEVIRLIKKYGLNFNPDDMVNKLTLGEQQRIELIKILMQDAKIIILDEPTASLTVSEVDALFNILKKLKDSKKSILFISHKLPEVIEISDRISIMRQGKIYTTINKNEANVEKLTELMTGEELKLENSFYLFSGKEPVFKLENVKLKKNREVYLNISLEVKEGEILGVVGIEGNGQKELEGILSGFIKPDGGKIFFKGQCKRNISPEWLKESKISIIPSRKIEDGLVEDFTVYENCILGRIDEKKFSKFGLLQKKIIVKEAEKLIDEFNIEPYNPYIRVKYLSGGNQQKVILARELSKNPEFLIACNPTRGVDIKSTFFIRNRLLKLKEKGAGILLITSDIDEAFSITSRIAVLYRGRITGVFNTRETDEREIGFMMLGGEKRKAG